MNVLGTKPRCRATPHQTGRGVVCVFTTTLSLPWVLSCDECYVSISPHEGKNRNIAFLNVLGTKTALQSYASLNRSRCCVRFHHNPLSLRVYWCECYVSISSPFQGTLTTRGLCVSTLLKNTHTHRTGVHNTNTMSFRDGVDTTYNNKFRARGGQGDFSWDTLKGDKSAAAQEYYLGRSQMCEDLWYARDAKRAPKRGLSDRDMSDLQQQEEDAMKAALGIQPAKVFPHIFFSFLTWLHKYIEYRQYIDLVMNIID